MGQWWTMTEETDSGHQVVFKVPNSREDLLADPRIDRRSKQALVRLLRQISDPKSDSAAGQTSEISSFQEFLDDLIRLPNLAQYPMKALAVSPDSSGRTPTKFALSRIATHLRSMNFLGSGFCSVIAKYGGLAEIAQVCCRAGAVGGGIYVLGTGIEKLEPTNKADGNSTKENTHHSLTIQLEGGDTVSTDWLVGGLDNLPLSDKSPVLHKSQKAESYDCSWCRTISIISSPLTTMFTSSSEGTPHPAGAVFVLPSELHESDDDKTCLPPVNMIVHNSDTGECPDGQCTWTFLYFALRTFVPPFPLDMMT